MHKIDKRIIFDLGYLIIGVPILASGLVLYIIEDFNYLPSLLNYFKVLLIELICYSGLLVSYHALIPFFIHITSEEKRARKRLCFLLIIWSLTLTSCFAFVFKSFGLLK